MLNGTPLLLVSSLDILGAYQTLRKCLCTPEHLASIETQRNNMAEIDKSTELRFKPMIYQGSLDHLIYVEVTPIIGREYPEAKIKDILQASNAEQQLRDLAIIISERGVVFFRADQHDLSVAELKNFTDMVGKLSGRPEENGLHVHPLYRDPGNTPMGNGDTDENMFVPETC